MKWWEVELFFAQWVLGFEDLIKRLRRRFGPKEQK